MKIENNDLERVDLQLLAMVEDAQERLTDQGYSIANKFMMNGFSASAKFVNRFTVFHPEKLISVSAGGISGMPILPLREDEGHTLDYNVGVADVESLTGEPFDLDAFCEVNQFLYLGEEDENDPTEYSDVWSGDLKEIAMDVYGQDMQNERFPYSKSVYENVGASAVFRMYEETDHKDGPETEDVIKFHERSLVRDDIDQIRKYLGGNVPRKGPTGNGPSAPF